MDDATPAVPPAAPASAPLWRRAVLRRTVLATGAAGASAAALAVLWKGNDISQILHRVRALPHEKPNPLTNPRVRVAHLLRRAGFGATPAELDNYVKLGTAATTQSLLNYQTTSNSQLEAQLPTIDTSGTTRIDAGLIQGWWLQRMVGTARPLEEKMTLFWHGLLTSGLDKSGAGQMFLQNQLYRSMALGNFDDLLKAVSKDPAMLVYLDNETNRVGKPNENYARELMELFTTGIGHYTETDVQESARSFTGWTLHGGKQLRYDTQPVFVPRLHDSGTKTFMGKTGNFTGDDIVEMLVPLRATAERLSTKLFSFFAYPNPEKDIVHHLADTFQRSRYNVEAVVKEILNMDAFYSLKAYRALVKSPAEMVAQTLKATGTTPKTYTMAAGAMAPMGQELFYPPNVAGWPGGTSWINSTTLLNRVNFANAATQRMATTLPQESLTQLLSALVDNQVSPATSAALKSYAMENPGDQAGLLFMTLATPEYQLN